MLGEQLDKIQVDFRELESENAGLSSDLERLSVSEKDLLLENTGLTEQLKAGRERTIELEAALSDAESTIDTLNEQMSIAREESGALLVQIEGLKSKLLNVTAENDDMSRKLSSLEGLKESIRELKIKMRRERKNRPPLVMKKEKKVFESRTDPVIEEISLGNLGFIIKNGQSTYPARVKIEVQPSSEILQ